jgi:hypothetical protein
VDLGPSDPIALLAFERPAAARAALGAEEETAENPAATARRAGEPENAVEKPERRRENRREPEHRR